MINFYSSYDKCDRDKILVKRPYVRYLMQYNVLRQLDKSDLNVIEAIEGVKVVGDGSMISKFGNHPLIGLDKLSSGCKTVLCINHAIKTKTADKYIFDALSCGPNAMEYILENFKDANVSIVCTHISLGSSRNISVRLNGGELYDNTISLIGGITNERRIR